MKYLRKIASVIIAFIFLASLAIGLGVTFAVKNVNITLQSYTCESGSEQAEAEIARCKKSVLGELRGTIISFISSEDVEKAVSSIEGGGYTLVGVSKKYPCTLNITIRERKETFVVASGSEYFIYDMDGVLLRTATEEEETYNPIDNAPNVTVNGVQSEDDMVIVAAAGAMFENNFAYLRSTVDSITLIKAQSQYVRSKLVFVLRCGLNVEITDYESLTEEKISAAADAFADLSGEKKLGGRIYVYEEDGVVFAKYDKTL